MTDLMWVLSGSVLILAVAAIRAALGKRLHPGLRYALWGLVLLRLLLPGTVLTSPVSVQGAAARTELAQDLEAVRGVGAIEYMDGGIVEGFARRGGMPDAPLTVAQHVTPERFTRMRAAISIRDVLQPVWIAGIAVTAGAFALSNVRFYRGLRRRRQRIEADCPLPVYTAASLPSSFLLGGAVYVTEATAADSAQLRHVLAHELAHRRHGDPVWAVLRCAALALHWYNPLVWWAASLSRRDAELFADAGALSRLGEAERQAYGATLIRLSAAPTRQASLLLSATTMSGGKRSLKERVAAIAKARRTRTAAVFVLVAAAVLAAACTFTGGGGAPRIEPEQDRFLHTAVMDRMSDTPDAAFRCEDHVVLGARQRGGSTVVYLWVREAGYDVQSGAIREVTGAHYPAAVTVRAEDAGYVLEEFWMPRDGGYYASDLRAKFPAGLYLRALDPTRYAEEQGARCLAQAEAHFASATWEAVTEFVDAAALDPEPVIAEPVSIDPADYGLTEAMLRSETIPGEAYLTPEALGAYLLHADGAGAEWGAYNLCRLFLDDPAATLTYLVDLGEQTAGQEYAAVRLCRAIAAEAWALRTLDHLDAASLWQSALETCRAAAPAGRGAQLTALLAQYYAETSALAAGDVVIFGEYRQDWSEENGGFAPIEWLVLEVQEDRALLLSRYCLDCAAYAQTYGPVTWESAALRGTLNGTFFHTAFTADEQARIVETTVSTPDNTAFGYTVPGGADTQDRIFLLSIDEAGRYLFDESVYGAALTPYAAAVAAGAGAGGDGWWLRSPGSSASHVAQVREDTIAPGGLRCYEIGAVRPALWLALDDAA